MKNEGDPSAAQNRDLMRKIGSIASVISELIACIGGGVAIGYFFWSESGAPIGVLLLTSVLGLILGFYRLYRFVQKQDAQGSLTENSLAEKGLVKNGSDGQSK